MNEWGWLRICIILSATALIILDKVNVESGVVWAILLLIATFIFQEFSDG